MCALSGKFRQVDLLQTGTESGIEKEHIFYPDELPIEPRPLPEPLGVSGWMGFPAGPFREQVGPLLVGLIEDTDRLFRQYPIDSVYSSEPRSYRRTSRGRDELLQAVRTGRAKMLTWGTPSRGPGGPGQTGLTDAQCTLTLPSMTSGGANGGISIVIQPATQSPYHELVRIVSSFLNRWFAPLDAASAFVSHYGITKSAEVGDHPSITRYERRVGRVLGSHAVKRYVRGVFWAMGLGEELCSRLGGQTTVLRDAPVFRASQIGAGVWLQVSEDPPGAQSDLVRLEAYLKPLLPNAGEIRVVDGPPQATGDDPRNVGVEDVSAIVEQTNALPGDELLFLKAPKPKPVPIRGLRALLDLEVDAALNVHLERPPTRSQLIRVVTAMQAWYQLGFEGAFGGAGFHSLTGPTIDGRVLRWNVDLGSADADKAIRALAAELGGLIDVHVIRLVVGTQSVG